MVFGNKENITITKPWISSVLAIKEKCVTSMSIFLYTMTFIPEISVNTALQQKIPFPIRFVT